MSDKWEYDVGDVTSPERGSGARANGGKPQLDLIPIATWEVVWAPFINAMDEDAKFFYRELLDSLRKWQEGDTYFINHAVAVCSPWVTEAVRVFEYGKHKYAAWNWAKGMAWSIPLGCVLRHLEKVIVEGQLFDDESGLAHMGHVLCNLIMLQHYKEHYPEGDDRPGPSCFNYLRDLQTGRSPLIVYNDKEDAMRWAGPDEYLDRLRAQSWHREEPTGL